MDSNPTAGSDRPSTERAYPAPSRPNCAIMAGLGSAVAPASTSTVAPPRSDGSATASAGRSTPAARPMPRTAQVTTAPVDPADTNEPPTPWRTRSQPTARLDPASAAVAAPRSDIGTACRACTTAISPSAPCRHNSLLSCGSAPTRMTGTPCARRASTAPATASAGPWSPPIASSTTGPADPPPELPAGPPAELQAELPPISPVDLRAALTGVPPGPGARPGPLRWRSAGGG